MGLAMVHDARPCLTPIRGAKRSPTEDSQFEVSTWQAAFQCRRYTVYFSIEVQEETDKSL